MNEHAHTATLRGQYCNKMKGHHELFHIVYHHGIKYRHYAPVNILQPLFCLSPCIDEDFVLRQMMHLPQDTTDPLDTLLGTNDVNSLS
jgi:hypothetical protein